MDDIRDDQLEGGLFEAFRGESVLEALQRTHGVGSSLLLRDADEGDTPVLLRREEAGADDPRFQVLGEIARGGIGVVYKGRDKDLNREVALKVLRPEFKDRDDVVQRFIEEAQVGGQLQHPGIVPVYGLGLQPDGRPSFAMKLIKGQTLAELLDSNPRGIDLLAVFEQVTQTIAYAHSRGVIHRDLKPANVMVGAFGEVQVVDWGFAKVLGHEELKPRPQHTVIATVRTGEEGSASLAGSVMGTPAYMPPEQALGRIDDLDERSDIFALGAILCEILTGKPPYTGEQKDQIVAASQCRLEPALERLDAADAADDLKRIVRDCLEPLSADRPRHGQALSERLAAHFANAEERARRSELDAAESEAKAASEQAKRRRALIAACIALVAVLAGGGGYFAWDAERKARERRAAPQIAAALREAKAREGDRDWIAALAAAQRAADIAASEGVDDAGAAVMLKHLEQEKRADDDARRLRLADERLLRDLEAARAQGADHYDWSETDAAYVAAVKERWPSMQVDTERLKQSENAEAYAAAFDAWASGRDKREGEGTPETWARAIDPEHDELRDAVLGDDITALKEFDAADQPASRISFVANALLDAKRNETAIDLLQPAVRREPGDFWLQLQLGRGAQNVKQHVMAMRHLTAALAIRPKSIESRHRLGISLEAQRDFEGAIRIWREAVALQPNWAHGKLHIALAMARQGKHGKAVALSAEALAQEPDSVTNVGLRASVLEEAGDLEGAHAAYLRATELGPGSAQAHTALGTFLSNRLRHYAAALEAFRKALELRPGDLMVLNNIGTTLSKMGQKQKALAAFREVRKIDPANARAHAGIGGVHYDVGNYPEAERWLKKAVDLDPGAPFARVNLSKVLRFSGRPREALPHARAAARLLPHMHGLWLELAQCSRATGDFKGALDAWRKTAECDPDNLLWRIMIGQVLCDHLRRFDDAIEVFAAVIEADEGQATAYANTGVAYGHKREFDKAIRWLEKSVELAPNEPGHHFTLANNYRQAGMFKEAADAYEKQLELRPRTSFDVQQQGVARQRLAEARRLIALERRLPGILEEKRSTLITINLATLMLYKRRWNEAVRLYDEAFERRPALNRPPLEHLSRAIRAAAQAGPDWHDEGLAWARDFLEWRGANLENSGAVIHDLMYLKHEPYLAPVRDGDNLAPGWKQFWRDLDALLKRVQSELEHE